MAKSLRTRRTKDNPRPLPPRRAGVDSGRFTITMQPMQSGLLRLVLPIRIAYLTYGEIEELIAQLQRSKEEL